MSYALPPQTVRTTTPTVTDDSSKGFYSGFTWANTTTSKVYYCISSAVGAAVWVVLGTTLTLAFQTDAGSLYGPDLVNAATSYGSFATAAGALV